MLTLRRNAAGIWQISGTVTIWRDGQHHSSRIRVSSRTTDKVGAEGIARQIENQAAQQNSTGRQPARPFALASADYVAAGGEARFLDKLDRELGHLAVDTIGQAEIDAAAKRLLPAASPATRNRQVYTPAIAVLRYEGMERLVRRPRGGGRRTVFFTPAQADRQIKLISASRFPNPWTPALATFLFCQGSRVSETLALDGRDVNLAARYAILRDTKNGEERMVPLYARTLAALAKLPNLGDAGPLFLRYDGRPYTGRQNRGGQIRAVWSRACDEQELDPVRYSPHTARHSWATWFYSATRDVVRLKHEGGWKSNEWERYVKLASPGLADQARRFGFVFDAPDAAATAWQQAGN